MSTAGFDFDDSAELYICRNRRGGQKSMIYRRFDTAAAAIRFTIEELTGASLLGTILEVGGDRYRHGEIRKLYDSEAFPLSRQSNGSEV